MQRTGLRQHAHALAQPGTTKQCPGRRRVQRAQRLGRPVRARGRAQNLLRARVRPVDLGVRLLVEADLPACAAYAYAVPSCASDLQQGKLDMHAFRTIWAMTLDRVSGTHCVLPNAASMDHVKHPAST